MRKSSDPRRANLRLVTELEQRDRPVRGVLNAVIAAVFFWAGVGAVLLAR